MTSRRAIEIRTGKSISRPSPPNQASAKAVNTGKLNGVTRLATSVRLTDNAMSALERSENRLLVIPPGLRARIINPMPTAKGGASNQTSRSALSGTSSSCENSPANNSRGARSNDTKALACSFKPILNMIINKAIGKPTCTNVASIMMECGVARAAGPLRF